MFSDPQPFRKRDRRANSLQVSEEPWHAPVPAHVRPGGSRQTWRKRGTPRRWMDLHLVNIRKMDWEVTGVGAGCLSETP